MPKVSEQYLEQRRQQIVTAAARCFAQRGFAETTMQDVFTESGLSAGAVYRYFPSKESLAQAIAEGALGELAVAFDRVLSADPPPPLDEAMLAILQFLASRAERPDGVPALAVQIWGLAVRSDQLRVFAAEKYGYVRGLLTALVRREQAAGAFDPEADPEQVGRVLFGCVVGFVLQLVMMGDVDPKTYAAGFRALLASPAPVTLP